MAVTLRGGQLRTLLTRLKELPRSRLITGELQSTIDNRITHYDFIVDTWPNFKALLLRPDLRIKYLQNSTRVYAQEPENLKSLLRNKALLDWSKSPEFTVIDSRLEQAVSDVAKEHGKSVTRTMFAHVYSVNKTTLKLHPVPEGLKLSTLHPNQCDLVNSLSDDKRDGSASYIRMLIETFPSCCLYNNKGEILGYILSYHHGYIGMLRILEEHRGKGYAKVLLSQLINESLKTCDRVYGFVDTTNKASIQLQKCLGVEVMEDFKILWKLNAH